MGLVTCAGSDVISGRVKMPERGAWSSELKVDTAQMPSGQVKLEADGGISLSGTVLGGAVYLDVAHVHLVGGAGGLGKSVTAAAYRNAQLRDPLTAVLNAGSEKLSDTVEQTLLTTQLPFWSTLATTVAVALDQICAAAGDGVLWRVLADGSIWIGVDTWPAESLPDDAVILDEAPDDGRYLIGVQTPALLPGVNLSDLSKNVVGVDHWISADEIRTVAWTQ